MQTPLACLLCSIDPGTTAAALPVAQAAVLAAPLIFRDQLRRAVRTLRDRRAGIVTPDEVDEDELDDVGQPEPVDQPQR